MRGVSLWFTMAGNISISKGRYVLWIILYNKLLIMGTRKFQRRTNSACLEVWQESDCMGFIWEEAVEGGQIVD